jgi:cytochrome c-type biogenesis protein
VATAGGAPRGALLLGLFGLGAALPLVAAAYASRAGFGRMRAWVLAHGAAAKRVLGGVLLLVGVLILTGGDHAIEAWVNDRLPDAWLALTTTI